MLTPPPVSYDAAPARKAARSRADRCTQLTLMPAVNWGTLLARGLQAPLGALSVITHRPPVNAPLGPAALRT